MILKLMAVLRCHFVVVSENIYLSEAAYEQFWSRIEETFQTTGKPYSSLVGKPVCLHGRRFTRSDNLQYVAADIDNLKRPIPVLEVPVASVQPANHLLGLLIQERQQRETGKAVGLHQWLKLKEDPGAPDTWGAMENSFFFRIFDNTIAIAELDLHLPELPSDLSGEILEHLLGSLLTLGNDFMNRLMHYYYAEGLLPMLVDLFQQSRPIRREVSPVAFFRPASEIADHWNMPPPSRTESASAIASLSLNQPVAEKTNLLWVSRALIFETSTGPHREPIIRYWVGPTCPEKELKRVLEHDDANALFWGNYLFRENSWDPGVASNTSMIRKAGRDLPRRAFAEDWEAMIYAQYYYAAMECLDVQIDRVLGISYTRQAKRQLPLLHQRLEMLVTDTHQLIFDYQRNRKFLKRPKLVRMQAILDYWEFQPILERVEQKITLCADRLESLHQRSVDRNALYTDLILLGIGITSVTSLLLEFSKYGRELASDAALGGDDVTTFGFLEHLSGSSTDFILFLSLILTIGLAVVYFLLRKRGLISE